MFVLLLLEQTAPPLFTQRCFYWLMQLNTSFELFTSAVFLLPGYAYPYTLSEHSPLNMDCVVGCRILGFALLMRI